jgi:alanyl-tRNA synthetase
MRGDQIRETFTSFFAERGHTPVPSASLIPHDPSLLLTVAGMVPFKPYLLMEVTPPYTRAVSIQKCLRTEDIDIIGTTARHLTFFEMMGNFSFGEYFKEQAIPWAYELVTEGFGLDPDRLWFTVHLTDDDAESIWIDGVGIPPDRVQRRDRDNFWQMGVAGPCGPCSEIFYDKGPAYGEDGGPIVDEERFVEVWNLVFMQNVQDEPYHVIGDLPAKSIDTGAGLERLATVLQGVDALFDTDIVRPILATAENLTGVAYGAGAGSDVSLRVMADHARAVTFMLGDGVVPSNEGRGYVLRRLLRRSVRHAYLLGAEQTVMPALIGSTVAVMGRAYPELAAREDALMATAEREEHGFRRTLASGHQLLDADLVTVEEGGTLPGESAFKLHDTYGFPVEITEEILAERGLKLDRAGFDRLMDEQRERARAAFKGGAAADAADAYRTLLRGIDQTDFFGYDLEQGAGRVLSVITEGEAVERADTGQPVEVYLDRTPFYAESGGQVGDTGTIVTPTGKVAVADTTYSIPGVHGHRGKVVEGWVGVGQDAELAISSLRRERIRKNHTGTHLLHWALRDGIGGHVHQAGSRVEPDKLRFDFSHFEGLDDEALAEVEGTVNSRIVENATVSTVVTTKEEAEAMGALAFFGDKYGDEVRVVRAGDYSIEFCGGTHVHTTGQIGPLILVSEGSVAANTRRVEALTGTTAYEYLTGVRRALDEIARVLRTQPGSVVQAARDLSDRLDRQEERLAAHARQAAAGVAAQLVAAGDRHGDAALVVGSRPELSSDDLRALALQVRHLAGSGVTVLGTTREGKGTVVAVVSRDLVEAGVSAADLVRPAAEVLGGGGGRDPEVAQAGGPNGDRLDEALEAARTAGQAALLAR